MIFYVTIRNRIGMKNNIYVQYLETSFNLKFSTDFFFFHPNETFIHAYLKQT